MFLIVFFFLCFFRINFCGIKGRPGPGLVTLGVSQISDSEEEEEEEEEGSLNNSNGNNDDRIDDININDEDDYESDDDDDDDDDNVDNNPKKKRKKLGRREKRKNKRLKRKNEKLEIEIINLENDDEIIEIDIQEDQIKNNSRKSLRQVLHDDNENKKWEDEEILDLIDDESASDGENFKKKKTKNNSKNVKKKSRNTEIEEVVKKKVNDTKEEKISSNDKRDGLKGKGKGKDMYRDRGNSTCSSDGDFAGVVLTDGK